MVTINGFANDTSVLCDKDNVDCFDKRSLHAQREHASPPDGE